MRTEAPKLPDDPMLAVEQATAQSELSAAMSQKNQGDMAALMARYGTNLALAGNRAVSPLQLGR